jgi:E3 ubiquitin-protein ligase listerin
MLAYNAYRLLSVAPSLLLAYLSRRRDEDRTLELWHALLAGISQQSELPQGVLLPLLDAARNGLPNYLKPKANELDKIVGKLLSEVLHSSTGSPQMYSLCQLLQTARKCLFDAPFVSPANLCKDYFLSDTSFHAVLQTINSAFSLQVDHALHNPSVPLSSSEASLDLMVTVVEHWPQLTFTAGVTMVPLADIFIFAYLLPRCYEFGDSRSVSVAQSLWTRWLARTSTDCHPDVIRVIKVKLRALIVDTQARPR